MTEIKSQILSQVIQQRSQISHKGNYGRILLIGGSVNYGGAIIMATEGAINAGSGLICVATHSLNLAALHARDPEAMFLDWRDRHLSSWITKVDVIVCGPGLGTDDFAKHLLKTVCTAVTAKQTLVLDASALDLIGNDPSLLQKTTADRVILTPHQMEWQRLSRIRIPFQSDSANQNALNQLLPNGNGILVLKSHQTHLYDQHQHVLINPLGNPGMATGGTGDTLSGIIGSFCGQFGNSLQSVAAAVYLHSMAADLIFKTDYVVRPTKLSACLPKLMKETENQESEKNDPD